MRRIALSCAGLALASCSLFWDTSEFTSDPAVADGGAGTPDTSIGETSSPPPDGGHGGGLDASSDAEAAAPTFCASLNPKPKFCDDFDDPNTTIAARWNRLFIDPSGIGVIEKTDIAREGKALSVRMNNAPDCSYTRVEKDFATNGKDIHVSFSMRPTTPWKTNAIYTQVRFNTAGQLKCQIFLQLDNVADKPSEGWLHFQFGPGQDSVLHSTAIFPKEDVWSKVEMTVRANGTVLHSINGKPAIEKPFPTGCDFGESTMVSLGYNCEDLSPEVRYDDVVVDYP